MSYRLADQIRDDSIGTPAPPRNTVEHLLIKLRLKEQLYLSSWQLEEALRQKRAWKANVDLAKKIIIDSNYGFFSIYGCSHKALLKCLPTLISLAEDYNERRDKLPGWVCRRVESELLVTLQALTSIDQLGCNKMEFVMQMTWEALLEDSIRKMQCWLGGRIRMARGLLLFPGKPEDATVFAVMPEKFRKPLAPPTLPPQPKLEALNEALADWRQAVEAWEAGKSGIRISTLRTRGDYLVQQMESSIEVMAASPKLQKSQMARDRLQASMAAVRENLHEALKGPQEESEDAFIADLDALDWQGMSVTSS